MRGEPTRSLFEKRELLTVIGLIFAVALVFLPGLGAAGMFDPTDSFFIESGREMFKEHELVVPLMNYEWWLDKPAFAFWLIVSSYKLFGVSEFAGRLPSAVCAALVVVLVYLLTRRLLSRRQALLSSLLLASCPLQSVVGHVALTDEPLAVCLTTALLSMAVALIEGSNAMLILSYVALALGVLCKGPLALVLVGLVTAGYLVARYRFSPADLMRRVIALKPWLAVLALCLIALPYYVYAHIYTHGEFTATFFLRQNLGRMAGVVNHVRPFWYYVPVVALGYFPWSLLLTFSGPALLRLWKRRRERHLTARSQLALFCLCWAILGFTLFSLVPTKLETYIVPILPAIAVLGGVFLDLLIRLKRLLPVKVATMAMLAAAVALPFALSRYLPGPRNLLFNGYVGAAIVAVYLAFALALSRSKRLAANTVYITCGACVFACMLFVPLLFQLYHGRYQDAIDRLALFARDRGANLAIVRYELPSLVYRYERKIPVIQNEAEMRSFADAGQGSPQWILVHKEVLSLLCWTERSPRVVIHDDPYWLFAVGPNARSEAGTVEWHGLKGDYEYPTMRKKFAAASGVGDHARGATTKAQP